MSQTNEQYDQSSQTWECRDLAVKCLLLIQKLASRPDALEVLQTTELILRDIQENSPFDELY